MDTEVFAKKTSNNQRPRNDRFVRTRSTLVKIKSFYAYRSTFDYPDSDTWDSKLKKKKAFASSLNKAFGIESKASRRSNEFVQPWPCVPRPKSFLTSPNNVLDLPGYGLTLVGQPLDWNSKTIVAALGWKYYKWSCDDEMVSGQGLALNQIYCCKFDPRGEFLALGTTAKIVEIHKNSSNKCAQYTYCRCQQEDSQIYCVITALDWSPSGNAFAFGCSEGYISAYTRDCLYIKRTRAGNFSCSSVKISPDSRYLAVSTIDDPFVAVFIWPDLLPYCQINPPIFIKAIAWHPWRSALLSIGGVRMDGRTMILMLDAPTGKRRHNIISPENYCIDTMLFSHRTGELVMTLWKKGGGTRLLVMSDPETVVDHWGEGRQLLDRVRAMVFSPDGTKLATATIDEDLIIWNFLPEDHDKKKTGPRMFSAMPVQLDVCNFGISWR